MHRRNQRTLMLILNSGVFSMRTISASEFKKRCASVVTEVHSTREPVLITKFGKPIARLVPAGRPAEIHWTTEGHHQDRRRHRIAGRSARGLGSLEMMRGRVARATRVPNRSTPAPNA